MTQIPGLSLKDLSSLGLLGHGPDFPAVAAPLLTSLISKPQDSFAAISVGKPPPSTALAQESVNSIPESS